MAALGELELPVKIDLLPNEIDESDSVRSGRDASRVRSRAGQPILACSSAIRSRAEKISVPLLRQVQPGAFFLGQLRSRGHALLRPSRAAASGWHPASARSVTREAYAQEVSSVGFWPGSAASPTPLYYSYAYPGAAGVCRGEGRNRRRRATTRRCGNSFCPTTRSAARTSPDDALLAFAQSVYDAASTLGKWDRAALEETRLNPPVACPERSA